VLLAQGGRGRRRRAAVVGVCGCGGVEAFCAAAVAAKDWTSVDFDILLSMFLIDA